MTKKKMKLVFKCMRCGEELKKTPEEMIGVVNSMRTLLATETSYEMAEADKINKIYHECDDSMYGIAEMIGFDLQE